MDDFDLIDLPDNDAPASPAPTVPQPPLAPRKRIFTAAQPKVSRYERRDRERDDRYAPAVPVQTGGRVPPHDVEAEAKLLGACILDGADILSRCESGKVKPESFYVQANQVIYRKMMELRARKLPVDLCVLASALLESKQLEAVGGYSYLTRLETRVPTTAGAAYFIARVRELARLRDIITAATRTVEGCYGYTGPEDMPAIVAPLSVAWEEDASLMERVDARAVRFEEPPPKAETILSIATRPICTQGNLSVMFAQAKAGKTTSIGGALTGILLRNGYGKPGSDTLGWDAAPIGDRVLIYIDTEQSISDHWETMRRYFGRARCDKHPEWLWNRCLTGFKPEDIQLALGGLIARAQNQRRGVYLVIVDGVADLAGSVNEEEETTELVSNLHMQAIEANCPILCVMHRNEGEKADSSARGHLGKQLARKVESNLRLEKRDGISYVFADQNRGAPLSKKEGPAFRWSEPFMMHVSLDQEEKERFLAEMEEANAPRKRSSGGGGGGQPRNVKRNYSDMEFLSQFPFGEKAAMPLPVIRKRCCSNLGISEAKFSDERFNQMTAGTIQKIVLPSGEERYYR